MKNNEINEFETCRRFVRKVRHCHECLHFGDCINSGRPVALASREFAEVERMVMRANQEVYKVILPAIRQKRDNKATASCRLITCRTHKYCVAIAYNDRTYDYLRFNEKPELKDLNRIIAISVYGHFGKDITK